MIRSANRHENTVDNTSKKVKNKQSHFKFIPLNCKHRVLYKYSVEKKKEAHVSWVSVFLVLGQFGWFSSVIFCFTSFSVGLCFILPIKLLSIGVVKITGSQDLTWYSKFINAIKIVTEKRFNCALNNCLLSTISNLKSTVWTTVLKVLETKLIDNFCLI